MHCPYCHGWEVRDELIGILAVSPSSIHQALLFRQLSDDIVYFTRGNDLDEANRAGFAARHISIIDTPITEVVPGDDGGFAGVRLTNGQIVARRVLAVSHGWDPTFGHGGAGSRSAPPPRHRPRTRA